jgi:hypothetical protein
MKHGRMYSLIMIMTQIQFLIIFQILTPGNFMLVFLKKNKIYAEFQSLVNNWNKNIMQ